MKNLKFIDYHTPNFTLQSTEHKLLFKIKSNERQIKQIISIYDSIKKLFPLASFNWIFKKISLFKWKIDGEEKKAKLPSINNRNDSLRLTAYYNSI